MHRSYVAKEWIDDFLRNPGAKLPDDALTRFFSVVRIKPHELVAVFDGGGREIRGRLTRVDKTTCVFIEGALHQETPSLPQLVVMQAALDDGLIAETIKRGCEFGVDSFILFDAERSDRFCFDKLLKKLHRLVRIAQDACRQSQRLFVPSITFAGSLDEAIRTVSNDSYVGFFGDLSENKLLSQRLLALENPPENLCVVIGPEGGLSPSECDKLRKLGFFGVRFAPFVLRSELASLSAIAVMNAYCGRA